MYDHLKASLDRKDRKIEELRSALEWEKDGRRKAESEKQLLVDSANQAVMKSKMDVIKQREVAEMVNIQYQVLKTEVEVKNKAQEKELRKIREELANINDSRSNHMGRFAELYQLHGEIQNVHLEQEQVFHGLASTSLRYKQEFNQYLRGVVSKASETEEAGAKLITDMEETVAKMKWVMNIKKTLKE